MSAAKTKAQNAGPEFQMDEPCPCCGEPYGVELRQEQVEKQKGKVNVSAAWIVTRCTGCGADITRRTA